MPKNNTGTQSPRGTTTTTTNNNGTTTTTANPSVGGGTSGRISPIKSSRTSISSTRSSSNSTLLSSRKSSSLSQTTPSSPSSHKKRSGNSSSSSSSKSPKRTSPTRTPKSPIRKSLLKSRDSSSSSTVGSSSSVSPRSNKTKKGKESTPPPPPPPSPPTLPPLDEEEKEEDNSYLPSNRYTVSQLRDALEVLYAPGYENEEESHRSLGHLLGYDEERRRTFVTGRRKRMKVKDNNDKKAEENGETKKEKEEEEKEGEEEGHTRVNTETEEDGEEPPEQEQKEEQEDDGTGDTTTEKDEDGDDDEEETPPFFKLGHSLSPLQAIAAHRCLDCDALLANPQTSSVSTLLASSRIFRTTHGPPIDLYQRIRSIRPSTALAVSFRRSLRRPSSRASGGGRRNGSNNSRASNGEDGGGSSSSNNSNNNKTNGHAALPPSSLVPSPAAAAAASSALAGRRCVEYAAAGAAAFFIASQEYTTLRSGLLEFQRMSGSKSETKATTTTRTTRTRTTTTTTTTTTTKSATNTTSSSYITTSDSTTTITTAEVTLARIQTTNWAATNAPTFGIRPLILVRDYITRRYQIAEAAAAGADSVLLVVSVLPGRLLADLISFSREECEMEPLVEVRSEEELDVALGAGAKVVAVDDDGKDLHFVEDDGDGVDGGDGDGGATVTERIGRRIAALRKRKSGEEGTNSIVNDSSSNVTSSKSTTNTNTEDDDNVDNNNDNDKEEEEEEEEEEDACALVALSSVSTANDVDRYRKAGVQMVLFEDSSPPPSLSHSNRGASSSLTSNNSHNSTTTNTDPAAILESLYLDPAQHAIETIENDDPALNNDSVPPILPYTGGTKLIKICGVTNATDALAACRAGVNLIGIVFVAKSKRCATVEVAKGIVKAVRGYGDRTGRVEALDSAVLDGPYETSGIVGTLAAKAKKLEAACRSCPLVVGVFKNQTEAFVQKMVGSCGLDLVQLHGKEIMEISGGPGEVATSAGESQTDQTSSSRCGGVPIIRAVDVETTMDDDGNVVAAEGAADKIIAACTEDPVAILLDAKLRMDTAAAAGNSAVGGTTASPKITSIFDWSVAETLQEIGLPMIVTGGWNQGNVGDAAKKVGMWGVDVGSGVELRPGKKDPTKLDAFVSCVRKAASEAAAADAIAAAAAAAAAAVAADS